MQGSVTVGNPEAGTMQRVAAECGPRKEA